VVTLTLLDRQQKTPLQQWCFENSTVIRIGRAVDNHVVLNDSLVSRYHLELKQISAAKKGDSWQVISQGTNGTFLNGTLINKCILPNNSLLQLAQGGPILKFQLQEIPEPDALPGHQNQNVTAAFNSSSCTHEGNSPNNLFCVHCGEPLSVQQRIRHYQVLVWVLLI
jgi:serine/threonine protein kinase, bacterial